MEYTLESAIARLVRNRVKIGLYGQDTEKVIYLSKGIGIKLWGAIDYLTNYCGYRTVGST